VISALREGFCDFFEIEMVEKDLTPEEIEAAQALREKKYLTAEWNFSKRSLRT